MRKRTVKWFTIAGLIVLLLTGCSLVETPPANDSIDPPPYDFDLEDVMGEHWGMEHEDEAGDHAPVTLYFKDANGYVAPVTMNIPMTPEIAQRALEYMIDGHTSAMNLPAGFTPLIPTGTTVEGMNIVEDHTAIVDFSREFADYEAADERKIVEAITWMLTGFPTIDRVKLRIDGEPLHEMPVRGFPLQEPLTRAIGINLESIDGVNLAAAQPVTLYFKSETSEFEYLVPVTRMIGRADNKAEAVLQELIAGPEDSGLYAVLAPDVEVLDVISGTDDLVTVDFNDYVLDPEFRMLEDSMQSVILSLTENHLAEQVQIKVNGNVELLSSNDQSLAQPVARPDHINIFDL